MPLNDLYCKLFIDYFLKQWAPIIPLWTGIMLKIIGEKEFLQNNQAAEALFSNLKKHQLAHPEREEEALNDFRKRSGVWEIGNFLRLARDQFR